MLSEKIFVIVLKLSQIDYRIRRNKRTVRSKSYKKKFKKKILKFSLKKNKKKIKVTNFKV